MWQLKDPNPGTFVLSCISTLDAGKLSGQGNEEVTGIQKVL